MARRRAPGRIQNHLTFSAPIHVSRGNCTARVTLCTCRGCELDGTLDMPVVVIVFPIVASFFIGGLFITVYSAEKCDAKRGEEPEKGLLKGARYPPREQVPEHRKSFAEIMDERKQSMLEQVWTSKHHAAR